MNAPTAAETHWDHLNARPARLRSPRGGIVVAGRQYRGGVFLPEAARPAVEALARVASAHAAAAPVVIGVAGFAYRLEPLAIAPAVGSVAFSLADLDRNRLHHVHRDVAGQVVCDCGDFTFRRCGTGQPCKHGRRLVELGLIPATTPTVLPPFAARGVGTTDTPSVATTTDLPAAVAGFDRWARDRMRPRRFEPGPDEMAEAAALMGWR